MLKYKKAGGFAALIMVSAVALVGCSTPDAGGSSGLTFWQHSDPGRDPVVQKLAGELEKEQPGLKVSEQFIPYAQYFDKLVTGLQSGTGPDVFQLPEEMSEQFIKAGLISPVPEGVATTDSIESTLLPAATERWKSDGKYYGLPTDVQTGVLYANADLLKECGGDPDNLPKTWDDLLAQAQECTVRDGSGKITQAGLDTSGAWNLTTQAMYQDPSAQIFSAKSCNVDLTSDSVKDNWSTVARFITGDTAVDSPQFLPGQNKFQLGKAVFEVGMPVEMGTLETKFPDINYAIGEAPTNDGKPSTFVRGWAYVVNAKAADQTKAWELVSKLGGADAQRVWFEEVGSLPALSTIPDDLKVDEGRKLALESLAYAHPIQNIAIKTTDALNEAFTSIGLGTSVDSALGTAQTAINGYVADALSCTSK